MGSILFMGLKRWFVSLFAFLLVEIDIARAHDKLQEIAKCKICYKYSVLEIVSAVTLTLM